MFRKMLNGPFKEAQQVPDAQGRRVVQLPEDDPKSMLELCKILHNAAGSRSKEYPYNLLNGLALLGDKYDFKEALWEFFHTELGESMDTSMGSTLSGFGPNMHNRSLEVLKIALLVGNYGSFSRASLVSAYVADESQLLSGVRDTFSGLPVSDTLACMGPSFLVETQTLTVSPN